MFKCILFILLGQLSAQWYDQRLSASLFILFMLTKVIYYLRHAFGIVCELIAIEALEIPYIQILWHWLESFCVRSLDLHRLAMSKSALQGYWEVGPHIENVRDTATMTIKLLLYVVPLIITLKIHIQIEVIDYLPKSSIIKYIHSNDLSTLKESTTSRLILVEQ